MDQDSKSKHHMNYEDTKQILGMCFDDVQQEEKYVLEFLEESNNNIIIAIGESVFCARRNEVYEFMNRPENHFVDEDGDEYFRLYHDQVIDKKGARYLMSPAFSIYNITFTSVTTNMSSQIDAMLFPVKFTFRNVSGVDAYTLSQYINLAMDQDFE